MTTLLKFPIPSPWKNRSPTLPDEVQEWLEEHPEVKLQEKIPGWPYYVFCFYDDMGATEFKLRFDKILGK